MNETVVNSEILLAAQVAKLKVNTAVIEILENAPLEIDYENLHVFRIDFLNYGTVNYTIYKEGQPISTGFQITATTPLTLENNPAYGRIDEWQIKFDPGVRGRAYIILHYLE